LLLLHISFNNDDIDDDDNDNDGIISVARIKHGEDIGVRSLIVCNHYNKNKSIKRRSRLSCW
jgi:hypothetical protein